MIPFEQINAAALAVFPQLVSEWFPRGVRRGHEWVLGDLSGSPGESLSINLNTAKWADFGGDGKGGDPISLAAAAFHAGDRVAAARDLGRKLGIGTSGEAPASAPVQRVEQMEEWAAIVPVPDDAPPPPAAHFKYGKPTHVARYLNRDGGLIHLIYRCEPEGGKQIMPLAFCEHANGRREWRWKSQVKPRSLYGAELLGRGVRVLLVEGETTCDAARRLLADYRLTVLTWPGGANAVAHADWSQLAGRDVVIWPDADPAGFNAAAAITIQLRHHGATVRAVELPADVERGWDLADAEREGWNGDRIMSFVDPREPEPEMEPDYGYYDDPADAQVEARDFTPLGHDRGKFYFFTSGGGQVREFTSRDLHSVATLCELAPLRYWEMNYPGKGEAGFNFRGAGDGLTRACYEVGIYDPGRIRGTGAWIDDGRTILHSGDRCIVDGVNSSIIIPGSRHIYEHAARLDIDIGEPLSNAEANMLRELCMACAWEQPAHMGNLLAGWCVIAPVCGAMPWRPHIWVTGEATGGKTWVLDNIIKPIVGPMALTCQSKTTEAALRQTLSRDARPIIFDEIETQNVQDRERVQHVLDLARQASSEDGAPIMKGTSGGKAIQFRIRSCFAFSSINIGMSQTADESRTVILTLALNKDEKIRALEFARLKEIHAKTMTPGFAGRLLARTLSLLPVIRENAEVFASAIARSGRSRRLGDTYGVMMAGAWSLRSRAVATAAEADKMVAETQWVKDAVAKTEVEPDWSKAFSALMQYRARVMVEGGRFDDIPLGDLIRWVSGYRNPNETVIAADLAETALKRIGMRVQDGFLQIAKGSESCASIFAKTAWATSWASTLCRMPGAKKNDGFAWLAGHSARVFSLPIG